MAMGLEAALEALDIRGRLVRRFLALLLRPRAQGVEVGQHDRPIPVGGTCVRCNGDAFVGGANVHSEIDLARTLIEDERLPRGVESRDLGGHLHRARRDIRDREVAVEIRQD